MADITLRIAWYRLGETYKSLTESWQGLAQSYEQFRWSRIDIVDMLFLGWLLAAFVVIGIVNLYVRFAKWRISRQRALDGKQLIDKAASGTVTSRVAGDGETVRWLNAAVSWLGKGQQIDWLIDACLHSLTEESKKHSPAEVQIRFDKTDIAQKMSSVEFASVSTDTSNPELLTILGSVSVSDVSLSISLVTSTVTSLQAVSCDVRIIELRGLLQVQSRVTGEVVSVKFHSPPQLNIQVIPSDYASIDRPATESVIRSAICGFKLELSWPPGGLLEKQNTSTLLTANHVSTLSSKPDNVDHSQQQQQSSSVSDRSSNTSDLVRQWQKDISGRVSDQSAVSESKLVARSDSSRLQATPGSVRTPRDRRLLVKMIKANGLMNKDFTGSCDPYCTVMADAPPQQHMTSVVKNTINPFFDEHFLLDITDETKQIKFEVFDRNRARPTDEFLGRAVVAIDEVRRVPSSRQIIPLTGKTSAMTSTSGSITVEFLLMEGVPGSNASDVQSPEALTAPYRYIETSHTMMPGGTMVTTSTVMTDRLRDGLAQPAYNEAPIRVEKSETSSSYNSQNSVLTSQTSNIDLNNRHVRQGLNSSDGVTEMALRELSQQQHSAQPKTTVITLTGRPKEQTLPTINTVQAPSNDDPVHNPYSTLPHSTETKKKSFASAFKKRFSRSGNKRNRAASADRFTDSTTSPDFRDNSLLRPPTDNSTGARIPEEGDLSDSSLARKTRSHSLSASFRNLFNRSKKGANNLPPSGAASRESSVSRATPGPLPAHTAALRGSDGSAQQPSPQLSTASRSRHRTPDYSPQTGYPYSTSVPAKASPLYQH